jgi:hypothetical protein
VREEITAKAADGHEQIDDETVAYILLAQKCFEDLRQVAAQLAGLLVLSAAGSKGATPDHPMLEAAERLHASAAESIRRLRPPPRASAHRDFLSRAAAALECALSSAQTHLWHAVRGAEIEPILNPLQAAYAQLRLASAALPGFEMISFDQACCGPQIHTNSVLATSHEQGGARSTK